jgi:plasmid stability protein
MHQAMDSKKATFNLDADLHQQLKVAAAVQRREMVDLVRDALTAYLGWNRMRPLG